MATIACAGAELAHSKNDGPLPNANLLNAGRIQLIRERPGVSFSLMRCGRGSGCSAAC